MFGFLRMVVAFLGWILVLIFAGAYAGYYVPPTWVWWFQVLALALPIVTLALIPLAVASFLVRRPRLAFVQIAAILLYLLRHAPFGLLDRSPEDAGVQSISMLTYNTHGASGYLPGDASRLIDVVREADADVVCLQEFGAEARSARPGTTHRALIGMGYRLVATVPEGRRETQRPIFSRLPVEHSELLPLSESDESYAVRAVLQEGSDTFSVYNVHLVGFSSDRPWRGSGNVFDPRDWFDFFRRSGSAYIDRSHEARALREHLANERHPYLVCGDFNSTSNQWAYRRVAGDLQDAFRMTGDGWGKTYHARMPIVRIDYVFASPEWKVLWSDVLDSGGSDHRPVVARLGMRD